MLRLIKFGSSYQSARVDRFTEFEHPSVKLKLVKIIICLCEERDGEPRCNIYVFSIHGIPSQRPILLAYAVCNYVSIIP